MSATMYKAKLVNGVTYYIANQRWNKDEEHLVTETQKDSLEEYAFDTFGDHRKTFTECKFTFEKATDAEVANGIGTGVKKATRRRAATK